MCVTLQVGGISAKQTIKLKKIQRYESNDIYTQDFSDDNDCCTRCKISVIRDFQQAFNLFRKTTKPFLQCRNRRRNKGRSPEELVV